MKVVMIHNPPDPLDPLHVQLVGDVGLLQEDEGKDGMRAQAEVVRSKTFPQCEESFSFYHFGENISSTLVLRNTVNILHTLKPGLGNVYRHGCDGGHKSGDH